MGVKLLLLTALSMVFFHGSLADSQTEAVEQLVKDIQEILTSVREGLPADYLETAATELATDVKKIIHDAGVKVTEEQAKVIVDEIAQALLTNAKDIKNPLKFEAHTMESAFHLLSLLADKLTEIVQSGSTDNLYETLLATKMTAIAIIDAVKDIDEIIKISHDAGQDDTVEAGVARRSWCVGWSKRRNQQETARDMNKRKWCVGWHKRNAREEIAQRKREWCVGWSRRDAAEEEEMDVDKRKWCVGWPNRRSAEKKEWCVGWSKRDNNDLNRRKWCVGWPHRRALVV